MEKLATALLIIIMPLLVLLTAYSAFDDKDPPQFETLLEVLETFPVLDSITESVDDLKTALSGFPSAENTQGMNVLEMIGMFFTSIWDCLVALFGFVVGLLNDFLLLMAWVFSLPSYL